MFLYHWTAAELQAVVLVLSDRSSQANYVVWCPNPEWKVFMQSVCRAGGVEGCLRMHVCMRVCVKHITSKMTGHLAICRLCVCVSVDSSVNTAWPLTPHFLCWLRSEPSPRNRKPGVKKSLVSISYLTIHFLNEMETKCRGHLLWQLPAHTSREP